MPVSKKGIISSKSLYESYSGDILNNSCNYNKGNPFILTGNSTDIIATTDNKQFIEGRYPNQRVVTYKAKKPQKKLFTEQDLFVTDTFSFGTQIGQINTVVCV